MDIDHLGVPHVAGKLLVSYGGGLALPGVARWAHLPHATEEERELRLARATATEAALTALPDVAADLGTDPDVSGRLRAEYEIHLRTVRAADTPEESEPLLRRHREDVDLRLALLAHKRAAVIGLRDARRIDDDVLLQVQAQLDIEEVRLARNRPPD